MWRIVSKARSSGFDFTATQSWQLQKGEKNERRSSNKTGGPKTARPVFSGKTSYFIIAAATFLNALMSASMCSSVYVGWVQKEIVASASECATGQLTFV